MHRVVSLIASSTEMVWALGEGHRMVARSHECDFPPEVQALPVVTEPKLAIEMDREGPISASIDAQVKALVREALAVYRVDTAALDAVKPTIIITQTQCEVCAVSLRDVEQAVLRLVSSRPKVVALEPNSLDDIFRDLRRVADALGVREKGNALETSLRHRMQGASIKSAAQRGARPRPRVACIEWVEPLMAAGNWMPTLVELAGGQTDLGVAGAHSPFISFEALAATDPDLIIVMPCGFDIPRTRREMPQLVATPGWSSLRAVRDDRVYLADGNQYFNRPGPRVVESLEILVEIFHEGHDGLSLGNDGLGYEGVGWERWPTVSDRMPAVGQHGQRRDMALETIRVSAVIPATPMQIYEAWMDGERHGAFTASQATVEPHVGGRHTSSDGYIEGTTLELEPGKRIVQSWRSLDFPEGSAESRLEVLLVGTKGGTELTLVHSNIPDGQGADYEAGWVEHYFKPMRAYFAPREVRAEAPAQPTAKKKAAPAKKKVAPAKKKPSAKRAASKSKKVAKKPARPHKKKR